jgi:hypothetical protein
MSFALGILVVCIATSAGLVSGFVLVRRSEKWCPGCGVAITVEHCPNASAKAGQVTSERSGEAVTAGSRLDLCHRGPDGGLPSWAADVQRERRDGVRGAAPPLKS